MRLPQFNAQATLDVQNQPYRGLTVYRPCAVDRVSSELRRGPSTGLGYSCDGLICTCIGDEDCNDMFTSAGCGDISQCRSEGGFQYCWCLRL